MASAESNDDLNQRLRSMIIGNAQDQNAQSKASSTSRAISDENDSGKSRDGNARSPKHKSARGNQNVSKNGNGQVRDQSARSARGQTRGTGAAQASRGQQSQRGFNRFSGAASTNPSTILQNPNRGRGGQNGLNASPQWRGGRGGGRGSTFRPLNRPRQPTTDELHAQAVFMESIAGAELPGIEMSREEFDGKERYRMHLEKLLHDAVVDRYGVEAPQIRLVPFGSLASGFGMPGSDMDLALISPSIPEDMPRLLEAALLGHKLGARLLTRTRVPILKVCEQPTAELFQALCEERKKWNEMTPEEKEEHDNGPTKKKDVVDQEKDVPASDATEDKAVDSAESAARTPEPNEKAASATPAYEGAKAGEAEKDASRNNVSPKTPKTPTTPTAPKALRAPLSPEHLQYLQLLQAIKKDKPKELDAWITANPPPAKFDLQAALHPNANARTSRKERPWYREKPLGPLDFPKHSVGILSDINFSNPLGIHNTALLHAYSACDVRVRLLVLFVKLWAGRRKINSGYNGTLSSYGYVLMVLHFLVNVASPPVCPNLQLWETMKAEQSKDWPPRRVQVPPNPADPNQVCEGADVRFHRNEGNLADLARRQLLTHNREPLGVLLRNFFVYYAVQGVLSPQGGFNWTRDVLSLRSPGGILNKPEKGWTGAKTTEAEGGKEIRHRYLFAIEDPFELGHNVGRTVTHHGIVAIRDEFRRVARMLEKIGREETHSEGELLETLIDVIPEKEEVDGDAKSRGENGESAKVSTDTSSKAQEAAASTVEREVVEKAGGVPLAMGSMR